MRSTIVHRMALFALLLSTAPIFAIDSVALVKLIRSAGLQVEETIPLENPAGRATKVIVSFDYIDPAGKTQVGKGKIVLPPGFATDGNVKFPLAYSAGYEMPDPQTTMFLTGTPVVVATPLAIELNPMSRLPNLDAQFLRAARRLPFIDDAKVVIFGGSAGGYTTLMLCAETFPVTAAMPMVPPINWGYNVSYFRYNRDRSAPPDGQPPQAARVPGLWGVGGMILAQHTTYYPADLEDRAWHLNSPIAQLDTITNPVLAVFSTADVLVPIDQVGRDLVRPLDPALFPEGFETSPAKLMTRSEGRQTLLDLLPADRYTLTILPADESWPDLAEGKDARQPRKDLRNAGAAAPATLVIPFKGEKQWEIVVVDEGPIVPQAGHFRHVFAPDFQGYVRAKLDSGIASDQLTPRKLERLMKRYAGVEWLDSGLRRLGDPQSERADVVRGLVTYVTQGPEHAARFRQLYRALPLDLQALGPASQIAAADVAQALRGLAD